MAAEGAHNSFVAGSIPAPAKHLGKRLFLSKCFLDILQHRRLICKR